MAGRVTVNVAALTGGADPAAVLDDDRAGDGQADARSTMLAVPGGVRPIEALEEVRLVPCVDAVARVRDAEVHTAVVPGRARTHAAGGRGVA